LSWSGTSLRIGAARLRALTWRLPSCYRQSRSGRGIETVVVLPRQHDDRDPSRPL
jgi:hypothetical protein